MPNGTPQHQMRGHVNPRCATCGRTPMQVIAHPHARCERMTLPFDELPAPRPIKADLRADVVAPAMPGVARR